MADKPVDSIILEIDATEEKAIGGIDNTVNSLKSLKRTTEGLDTDKLLAIRDAFKGFGAAGAELKQAGDGMKSITSAVRSLMKIDTAKLREVASAVEKIGAGLGSLGSNNRISIRIDSEGIKKNQRALEDSQGAAAQNNVADSARQIEAAANSAAQSVDRLSTAENRAASTGNSAASSQRAFGAALNQTRTNTANARIQELINKINQYKATMRGMESGKQLFNSTEYEQAINGLARLQEQFKQYQETVKESPKSMADIGKSIQQIGSAISRCKLGNFSTLLEYVSAALPGIETGGMAASAGFQSMAASLSAVQAAIPIIGIILTAISMLVNVVKQAANAIKNAIGKATATFKTAVNKVRQGISKMVASIKEYVKKFKDMIGIQDHSFADLTKKLKSITRLFTFMLLRSAFTKLFEGVTTGFQNLAKYSQLYGTQFNNSVSMIYSDFKWLANSLATVVEPLVNIVAPILDMIAEKLVMVTRALAQFFAAFTGKNTFTKAKKNWEDYAESIEGASKATKDYTADIDELNIIGDDSDQGGGAGAINPGDMFETAEVDDKFKDLVQMIKDAWENADFYEIGKMLGDKLAEALANIPWDKIKNVARKLGKSIATFINGFIQGEFDGKKVSWWIGHTLAEAINTAFEFVNSFVESLDWTELGKAFTDLIKGALETLDWPLIYKTLRGIGTGVSDFLNSVFRDTKMWSEIGTSIANALNSVIWGAMDFVKNFDFVAFGKAIATGLGDALRKIDYIGIGLTLTDGINGAFEILWSFATNYPWFEVALKFANGINSALANIDWTGIKGGFNAFCKGVGTNLNTAITQIDWPSVGKTFGESVNTIFSGLGKFLGQIDFKQIGKDIAAAINKAIKTIDWKNAGSTINDLVSGVCDLVNAVIDEVDWKELMGGVSDALSEVDWDYLLKTVFKVIASKWTFEKIFGGVSFTTIGGKIISGIKDGIDNAMSNIGTWIYDHIFRPVVDGIGGLFGMGAEGSSVARGIGGDIIGGFIKGLVFPSPLGPLQVFMDFVDGVKEFFGINSPSKVFEEIGGFIIDGFLNGIETFKNIKTTITNWAGSVVEWFRDGKDGKNIVDHFRDFGNDIVTSFKDKVGNTYTSVKDNVTSWASKVKEWFNSTSYGGVHTNTWTTYANDIITGFKTKIGNTYTTTKDNIITWANKAREWFNSSSYGGVNNGTWTKYANDIIVGFKDKIGNTYATTKSNISSWASDLKSWFSSSSFGGINNSTWTTYANNIITGFKDKIGSGYTTTQSNMTTWASRLKEWFSGSGYGNITSSQWNTYAGNIISGFKNKISGSYTESQSSITTWASSVKNWFTDHCSSSKFYSVASDVVNGFKNGIGALYSTCKDTINSWGSSIIKWFKDKLDVNSPSKVFETIAGYTVAGFNKGLTENGKSTKDIVSQWTDSFSDVKIAFRTGVDASALRDFQNNYGDDFSSEAIVERVQKEVTTNGAVKASLNADGSIKDAFAEALDEVLSSPLSDISDNTKRQADKEEQTNVYIGNRKITDAVEEQRSANGFRFRTT